MDRLSAPALALVKRSDVEIISSSEGRRILRGRVHVPSGKRTRYRCDVVIAYRHRLEWLPAAIESILAQQSVECQVHLVNDDSAEDDRWIRRRFARAPNLHWYRNRESIGPYRSLHGVWSALGTPYLAVQDADDIALPLRIWCAIRALEVTGCDIYGAAMEQFLDWQAVRPDRHASYLESYPTLRSGVVHETVAEGNILNGTMVCRAAAFHRLNGFADYFRGADTEFISRAHVAGLRMFIDDRIAGLRRIHDSSLSRCSEHGRGSELERTIRAQIGRLRAAAIGDHCLAVCRRFGALDRHQASTVTQRASAGVDAQAEQSNSPPRCLMPLDAQSPVFAYLAREGFTGQKPRCMPAGLPLIPQVSHAAWMDQRSRNMRRDIRVSERHGNTCHAFRPANHAPDMLAIVRSCSHRQGRPVRDTISGLFGPRGQQPGVGQDSEPIEQPAHYTRFFGLFAPQPGYPQGELLTNERLLAFIQLTRSGDVAFYTRILGHRGHWREGIMFHLHSYVVQWLLKRDEAATQGIRYLIYSGWNSTRPSMQQWKQRAGFLPGCVYDPHGSSPIEEAAPAPFPEQTLHGSSSAAAFFCAAMGGKNDVVHYHRAGLRDVTLVDHDFSALAGLPKRFPEYWQYLWSDAFQAAQYLHDRRRFDVVSCDAWSSQFESIACRHLATFHSLARRYLLLTVVPRWADAKGYDADWFQAQQLNYTFYCSVRDACERAAEAPRRLSALLSARCQRRIEVVDMLRRTNFAGGCYWMVIRK